MYVVNQFHGRKLAIAEQCKQDVYIQYPPEV